MVWVRVRCGCGHQIPVKVAGWIVEAAKSKPPESVMLTYSCRRCGIVSATVASVSSHQRAA